MATLLTAGVGTHANGTLLLRFDDRNFDAWERAIPLFAKYDAHATFCINGDIDDRAVSTMRKLKAAGHSLAAHGVGHRNADDAIAQLGETGYLETEIRPQLVAAEKAGVPLRYFVYPCSRRNEQTDTLLKTRFDRLIGGGFWKEAGEGRIVDCEELFVPNNEIAARRVLIGSSIGALGPTITGELERVVCRLAKNGETALFYSHNIVDVEPHQRNDISFHELEFLLSTAAANGVAVRGFDELGHPFGKLTRNRLFPGFDGKFCKMSPNIATDWNGNAILTYGMLLLSGSDVFFGTYVTKSTDGGDTWCEPKKVESIKDEYVGDVRVSYAAGIRYACKTNRWYAIGVSTAYRGDNRPLDSRYNGKPFRLPYYYNVNPESLEFGPRQLIELPVEYDVAMPFGAFEDDDGTVIISFYYREPTAVLKPGAWTRPTKVVCARYQFGKDGLEFTEIGEPITCEELKRGIGEPSIVKAGGKYWMTIRSDERGMLAESTDGLSYGPLKTWCWEDGTPIGNRNTQQHWLVLSDGIYLTYTREGATNDHVFRNRAPVFIAKFDQERMCLIRSTEIPLVPEYGARLGNFSTISDGTGRAWLMTAEWMQPAGCEKYGSDNALWSIRFTQMNLGNSAK